MKFSKLYEDLLVQPSPERHAYYEVLREVIDKCKEDRKNYVQKDIWFRKWFGE